MSNSETIDVDAMSDEELDSFLDEHTEVGSDMSNLDVVDEPESGEEDVTVEAEEETTGQAEEEEVTDEVDDDIGKEVEEGVQEEDADEDEEAEPEEETLPPVDLADYSPEEVHQMEEVYKDLFKTGIKASGVERTVRDTEHLKTLVRIGFSANENNRKIKPYLKQLRSLEQAGVSLEDDNVNFLVDLMNGDKDAIKELITNRHKIDEDTLHEWLDGDVQKDDYIAKNHVISDSRFQLEEILDEIKETPSYGQTVKFLGNIDDDGKVLVNENPELAKLINNDMENGIFQKALDEAYFRMDRGLLPKQSILQSYINVMQDETFYNSLIGVEATTKRVTNEETVADTKQKQEVVKRKKRASTNGGSKAPTKGRQTKVQSRDINKMSEDEFNDFYATLDIDD